MNTDFCLPSERFPLSSVCYLNGYCLKMHITWSAVECLRILGILEFFCLIINTFFSLKNVSKASWFSFLLY